MAKFCAYCGKSLEEGCYCDCEESIQARSKSRKIFFTKLDTNGIVSKIKKRMGIIEDTLNVYERNQNITPDNISSNEGEIPIKQFNIAILRSRIRGQRAEGRLQITNKRVIFRAAGTSWKGRNAIQNEFQINNIAGIEIRKSNRISPLNILGGILLTMLIMGGMASPFSDIYYSSPMWANILAILAALISISFFFFIKKCFWLKLAINSAGLGIISSMIGVDLYSILLEEKIFTFFNTIFFILALVWLFNMVLVSLVPNLIINIKTGSASDAVQIRRKEWKLFKETQEYTGFSEVIPWSDTDLAIKEIGAIINDVQILGDMAIETWKNK